MNLDPEILEAIYTNRNQNLRTLCDSNTVMLVFLRHFGCVFCRETMSDLTQVQQQLKREDIKLVIVHMATEDIAEVYFKQHQLTNISHISDPDLSLYEYFGLFKGSFFQLYGLKVWLRGLKAILTDGHGFPRIKSILGSYTQMPGIFILKDCQIIEKFIHKSAADRPNYKEMVDKSKVVSL